MKKLRIQPFLYRALHSSGFRLSFVLGLFLAVFQVVQMITPIDSGYIYPASLYAMWVGGDFLTVWHGIKKQATSTIFCCIKSKTPCFWSAP